MKKIRTLNLSLEDINAYNFGEYLSSGSKWISFGKDNDYPQYLRTLYLSSPTNQAVIDGTINLATGEGVEVVDPAKNPLSNKWLNENFPKDVVKKLLSDLKMYGFCVAQIYSGNIVKYSEAIKYRFDVDKNNFIWYSNDWENYTSNKNKPIKLPIYKEGTDQQLTILVITMDKKGYDYYAPVDYAASINYINLEAEISKYHLSNIKNGLFPSFIITFIGTEFSDEQMNQIETDINKKFGGSSNTGRAIIGFASTKDDATQLQTIDQPTLPDTYEFLTKETSEKILVGHGATSPLLFGITRDTGNGLGSNADELQQSFLLFYEGKLKHYQSYILEFIKKIMNGNLLYADVKFKTYNPFKKETTQTLSKIKQINEIDSQELLNKIDSLKIKVDDILISEKILTKLNNNAYYKFIKSSNNNNLVNKKLELLSKQGWLFKPDEEIIKNTEDYFFMEMNYMKKNK